MPSMMVKFFHIYLHLPNKQQFSYNKFCFQSWVLIQTRNNAGLTDVLVDFERTVISTISNLLPQLVIKGCFYYLCEKMWKHVESVELALHLRIFAALAFALTQNLKLDFTHLRFL